VTIRSISTIEIHSDYLDIGIRLARYIRKALNILYEEEENEYN